MQVKEISCRFDLRKITDNLSVAEVEYILDIDEKEEYLYISTTTLDTNDTCYFLASRSIIDILTEANLTFMPDMDLDDDLAGLEDSANAAVESVSIPFDSESSKAVERYVETAMGILYDLLFADSLGRKAIFLQSDMDNWEGTEYYDECIAALKEAGLLEEDC